MVIRTGFDGISKHRHNLLVFFLGKKLCNFWADMFGLHSLTKGIEPVSKGIWQNGSVWYLGALRTSFDLVWQFGKKG